MSFHGAFTREDFGAIERLNSFVGKARAPMICVFDYSDTSGAGNAFRDEFIDRAQQPHAMADTRRIIVATRPDVLNLAQTFAAAQVMIGSSSLEIVKSAGDARRAMNHATLDLQPVEMTALQTLLQADAP